MRVLALTTIFPHAKNPHYAPYTRLQAGALSKLCELEVLGLVPWFPGDHLAASWSHWGKDFSDVPEVERIDDLQVEHPRVLRIPKLGYSLSGVTYAASLLQRLAHSRKRLDALFATFIYPDGVAAIALGALLGIPVVVQAIGSDVNVVAKQPAPRQQLRFALPRAAGVVAVSNPLRDELVRIGARPERVHVIPTGLDKSLFRPSDREAARSRLGQPLDAKIILFVGRLVVDKGIAELLLAFERLTREDERYRLVIVGEGPERNLCEQSKIPKSKLLLAGELQAPQIAEWLAASNLLTLPSYREGTPNVILEALGSGRRVVATNVGGIPAVVRGEQQGELVAPRDVEALAQSLRRVASASYEPASVANSVELFDWQENARRVLAVLQAARGDLPHRNAPESGF